MVVAAYDVTANVQSLNINQMTTGSVANSYATDHWTFAAAASTQVQFDLLAESASGARTSVSTGPSERQPLHGHHGKLVARHPSDFGNLHAGRPGNGWGDGKLLVRDGSDRGDVARS